MNTFLWIFAIGVVALIAENCNGMAFKYNTDEKEIDEAKEANKNRMQVLKVDIDDKDSKEKKSNEKKPKTSTFRSTRTSTPRRTTSTRTRTTTTTRSTRTTSTKSTRTSTGSSNTPVLTTNIEITGSTISQTSLNNTTRNEQ